MVKKPKIAKAQGRSVTEWIGKTPDSKPPADVLLRILRRHKNTCYLTGIIIAPGQKWHAEHVKPLEEGGANRESNLAPALELPHEVKTAAEKKRQAKADRAAKKAFGLEAEPAAPLQSRNDLAGRPKPEKKPKERKAYVDPNEGLGRPAIFRRFQ